MQWDHVGSVKRKYLEEEFYMMLWRLLRGFPQACRAVEPLELLIRQYEKIIEEMPFLEWHVDRVFLRPLPQPGRQKHLIIR